MKTKLLFGAISAIMSVSCANATDPSNYTLKVNLSPDEDGMTVYITDFDSGNKVDSAIVNSEGIAQFSGTIDKPFYSRLLLEGERLGNVIIESATINFFPLENRRVDTDGEINTRMKAMATQLDKLSKDFGALPNDSAGMVAKQKIFEEYNAVLDKTLDENSDNPLGYMIFIEQCSQMDLDEFNEYLEKYPALQESVRVNSARNHLIFKAETSVGHMYKDFAISNNGKTQRLSDYVGDDHYTLVDFWASWCGPCIRETEVIKKLYEKYNGKGLEFLGVAVWDKPEDTKEAIEKYQLPWNMIIDAQTIPTDLYGISGIPCIILIAPDGTIVSRDKQDEELVADVEAAMEAFKNK